MLPVKAPVKDVKDESIFFFFLTQSLIKSAWPRIHGTARVDRYTHLLNASFFFSISFLFVAAGRS
jgi:hypothetical protein